MAQPQCGFREGGVKSIGVDGISASSSRRTLVDGSGYGTFVEERDAEAEVGC